MSFDDVQAVSDIIQEQIFPREGPGRQYGCTGIGIGKKGETFFVQILCRTEEDVARFRLMFGDTYNGAPICYRVTGIRAL